MAYIGNSPANVGNYQIVDDISSSFNGSLTSFALTSGSIAITPAKSGQLLVGVNGVMQEAADGDLKGVLVVNELPLVSIDFNHNPASSTFDATQTKVLENNFLRVLSWYDNEWGFSNRMLDTLAAMGKHI